MACIKMKQPHSVLNQQIRIRDLFVLQHSEQPNGQVENAEVRKLKYGNGSTETEVRK